MMIRYIVKIKKLRSVKEANWFFILDLYRTLTEETSLLLYWISVENINSIKVLFNFFKCDLVSQDNYTLYISGDWFKSKYKHIFTNIKQSEKEFKVN